MMSENSTEAEPPQPDSEESSSAPEQSPSESVDLVELESQVRERLGAMITRARKSQESCKTLFDRFKPFQEARARIRKILRGKDEVFDRLSKQYRTQSEDRVLILDEAAEALEREVEFRLVAADAQDQAWNDFQACVSDPAAKWFDLIHERQKESLETLKQYQQWLESSEQRWNGDATDTEANSKVENVGDDPKDS